MRDDAQGTKPGGSGSGEIDWEQVICHFVCSTAMTPDEVEDQVTFARMEQFYKYWRKHPPTHIVAAAFAGIKAQD